MEGMRSRESQKCSLPHLAIFEESPLARFRIALRTMRVGAALVGLGAMVSRYSREICAAHEQLKSLGSQVVETDCGAIEYARVGDGYPVLVIHGATRGNR